MLWKSTIPGLFQRLNIQADSAAAIARKEQTAKRLDFYHDEQLAHLDARLNQLFSDPSQMVQAELNIVRKVINNLAQVYRESPIRSLEGGSEADKALYEQIVETSALDVKLKMASRYVKLLKTILLRPVWRNDKLDLDILTGNILDVQTGTSPEDLQKCLVTDYGTSDRIEDVEYSLWTPEEWRRLNYRGDVIAEAENPYGVLPFLPVFDYPPPSSAFWLPGGADLISLQDAINLKLTDLLYLLAQQSFGVGWIKGTPGGASLRVDPGSLVELGEDGSLGFEAQKAELDQVVNSIDKLVKWACVSNGLHALSMSTDPTRQSGVAKAMDTKELNEIRRDDVAIWRVYEKQLFALMRTVHNTHAAKKLSESATLKIDFGDTQQETDELTKAKSEDLQLAAGIISPVDVAMRLNPDLKSREDALAHLLKIREEQKALSE